MREGLVQVAGFGIGIALVLGDPGYYPHFGFEPSEPQGFMPRYPAGPSEVGPVDELVPGSLTKAAGIVEVAEAFRHEEMWRE